jgi:hypothetical protein
VRLPHMLVMLTGNAFRSLPRTQKYPVLLPRPPCALLAEYLAYECGYRVLLI